MASPAASSSRTVRWSAPAAPELPPAGAPAGGRVPPSAPFESPNALVGELALHQAQAPAAARGQALVVGHQHQRHAALLREVERLFRRLKGFRRIFSRFDKLDALFIGFISFSLIADGLRLC